MQCYRTLDICSHRSLVYCFVNKRKNSRSMYSFVSPWTLPVPLLGLGEAGRSVHLSLWGLPLKT